MTADDTGIEARLVPEERPAAPGGMPTEPEEVVARILDPRRRGELYPLYHCLRALAPVHRTDHANMPGVWLVSGFHDAMAVYRNSRAVSDPATAEHFDHGGRGGPFYRMIKEMMLFLEADEHAQVRRLVARAFSPRSLAGVRASTGEYANRLVDAAPVHGEMDVVAEFAYDLPLLVICRLIGIDDTDFAVIKQLAGDFARGSETAAGDSDRARRADDAAIGFSEYFERLIAARRHDRSDDLLSTLTAAEEDGQRLTHAQLIANCVLLLQAGHETTTDTIGNALVALFRHPSQMELLRQRPDLTKNAVEELLRYDSTNQLNNRLLLDDVQVGAVALPAGDQVVLLVGAANRDPLQFPDPDRLQIERPTPQHLAFAFGAYYCLGNALARSEVDVALRTLLDRLPGLAPARATFEWRDTLRNRGPKSLLVAW